MRRKLSKDIKQAVETLLAMAAGLYDFSEGRAGHLSAARKISADTYVNAAELVARTYLGSRHAYGSLHGMASVSPPGIFPNGRKILCEKLKQKMEIADGEVRAEV